MEEKRYLFEEDKVSHALAVMALPAIASQLITLVYNLADTWFVGRTNNPYMVASCSLVLPVYMLTIVISNIFGAGGGTLISRLIGNGNHEEASRVSAACIWMALASSVLFSFLCLWGHLVLFASQYRAFFTGLLWSQYGWAVKYSA